MPVRLAKCCIPAADPCRQLLELALPWHVLYRSAVSPHSSARPGRAVSVLACSPSACSLLLSHPPAPTAPPPPPFPHPQCYCYICDCPAGECEEWGEGGSYVDHCNAHDDSDFFRGMKRQRKAAKDRAAAQAAARAAARAARAGFGFGGGISPSAAELMIMECAFAAVTGRPRPGSADVKAAAKPGLPRPCTLRSIPDPVADRDLMLLARIEVGVKAQGSHTIAKLRKRLAPTGFYLPPDLQSDAGDRWVLG